MTGLLNPKPSFFFFLANDDFFFVQPADVGHFIAEGYTFMVCTLNQSLGGEVLYRVLDLHVKQQTSWKKFLGACLSYRASQAAALGWKNQKR